MSEPLRSELLDRINAYAYHARAQDIGGMADTLEAINAILDRLHEREETEEQRARRMLGEWLVGGLPNEERSHRLIDYTDPSAKLVRRRDGSDAYLLALKSGEPTFVNVHVEGRRGTSLAAVIFDALSKAKEDDNAK